MAATIGTFRACLGVVQLVVPKMALFAIEQYSTPDAWSMPIQAANRDFPAKNVIKITKYSNAAGNPRFRFTMALDN
jgi:hypothetical protein